MAEFSELCEKMVLKHQRLLSSWNPQSNEILERIHQVLADCLWSFSLDEQTINEMDKDPFEEFLSSSSLFNTIQLSSDTQSFASVIGVW